MNTPRELAIKHSQASFFNSYIRDLNLRFDKGAQAFVATTPNGKYVLPVTKLSKLGVHEYGTSEFMNIAAELCSAELYARLENSIHNIELGITERAAEISKLYAGEIDFLSAEQGLHLGHNFHPTPKSRDEFTDQDVRDYSPEFGASFPIHWFFVKPSILFEERSDTFGDRQWQQELYQGHVPNGFVPYPAHPWQRQVWLKDPIILEYIDQGLMQDVGPSKEKWFATSSMRSLYSPTQPFMVKFSMTVRLTNSIRHMQFKEVSRGMQMHDAFATAKGQEFSTRYPNFKVMAEPAFCALKDRQGEPMANTIVLIRENPFQTETSVPVAVLATLTQDNPLGGNNLINTCLKNHDGQTWFKAFVETAVVPLFVAQADYGIMLGAHQQNLLLELKDGLPVGAYFRDFQGTGFSSVAEELIFPQVKSPAKLAAHVVPREAAKSLFGYYFVINSIFNTIAAVARASEVTESELIELLQDRLLRLSHEVRDPSIIKYLLTAKELAQKGNYRCCNQGLNENTTDNPLSIYNNIANPLYMEQEL